MSETIKLPFTAYITATSRAQGSGVNVEIWAVDCEISDFPIFQNLSGSETVDMPVTWAFGNVVIQPSSVQRQKAPDKEFVSPKLFIESIGGIRIP